MRLVRVSADPEHADEVKRAAFASGINSVSVKRVESHSEDGSVSEKVSIEAESSTPKAKRFIAAVMGSPQFDPQKISIAVRQPRSVFNKESISEVSWPLEVPPLDLFEEFWQFSHITYALVGRVLIAGILIGVGLIGQKLLFILAGLFFLPLLPLLMSAGLGIIGRQPRLAIQGAAAFLLSAVLLIAGGAAAALVSDPPLLYNEFSSFWASLAISSIVGAAAGLASIDDVGRRELIGLAAAAQVGIIPTWLGVVLVYGPPAGSSSGDVAAKAVSLAANAAAIVAASAIVLLIAGVSRNLSKVNNV